MSIELVTGVPGGGKSYFAAVELLKVYNQKNREIYTNINLKVAYDDYIKPLDVQELYEFATAEYELFKKFTHLSKEYKQKNRDKENEESTADKNSEVITLKDDEKVLEEKVSVEKPQEEKVSDEKAPDKDNFSNYLGNYDKYLKDSKLLNEFGSSFIVWDECQNDLQSLSADPIWIRFFSYHRHFDMNILLVTQDATLIHRRYRAFISRFYLAQNPAKRLISTTLRFKEYTDLRAYDKYFIKSISLKMNQEVHNFYDSGEKKVEKSVFLNKIVPVLVIIAVMIFVFFYFFQDKYNEPKKTNIHHTKKITHDTNSTVKRKSHHRDNSDNSDTPILSSKHVIFFTCNNSNCRLKNSSFIVPLNSMKKVADTLDMNILYSYALSLNYRVVAVAVNDFEFNDLMRYNLTARGDKIAKNNFNFHPNRNF